MENKSMLEIAIELMRKKRKPKTLEEIAEEVFTIKGIKNKEDYLAQFYMDFMINGPFICCGEDKKGNKLWDLKERQPSSVLDKDGTYYDELYDEEAVRHELSEETLLKVVTTGSYDDEEIDFDEEEEDDLEEIDEIEEELATEFDDEVDEEVDDIIADIDEFDDEDIDFDDEEIDIDDEDDEDDNYNF